MRTMRENTDRRTLARRASAEMTERKSVFIGTAAPVTSEEEARALIEEMRREYHDATHNVYAYILNGGAVARYSDDGEPQGTAGVPVLNVLKMSGATDLCVVVTRYFGGILLGAGGLVRAYSAAAKLAIDTAGIVTMTDFAVLTIRCSYSDYQKLTVQLPKYGATEDSTEFLSDVTVTAGIENSRAPALIAAVSELTNGRASAQITAHEERAAEMPV
ncbi:MAG: YigZ family protein [Ruminococcaceae bacterium]|nr:YigZ family protein [Oscillospiraceae bacterium]